HVSWSENRKTNPDMLANASGVPGLEVMVPLFVMGALKRGIPLTWAAKLMAENPARHFRLDHVKGALTPGRDADIAVLFPQPRSHVSWSENRKTNPDMLANASGVPGLEVMVPLFVMGALKRGIPLTWAAKLMAENPARHFRLDHVKGALTPGRDADIAVLFPQP